MSLMRQRRARPRRTIIIGAGVAGGMVLGELLGRPDMNYIVKGFVDDNHDLQGRVIHGVPVLGTSEDLPRLRDEYELDEAIIAMPSVKGQSVRKVVDLCRRAGLATQIIPGAVDVLTGRAAVSAVRPVMLEDLLRRPTEVVMSEVAKAHFSGKTVLVTGAAGSIGSELCRNLCLLRPRMLVLFDTDESGVFELNLELTSSPQLSDTDVKIEPVLGSITSVRKVDWLLEMYRPDMLFHAAARKHVPLMEQYPEEAVESNVWGTKLLAEHSLKHGVKTFVHISTDKAVEPASVMGATKRISELLILSMAHRSDFTEFVIVRFGNVIGSRGSALEVFRRQLEMGGPVTVTHPEMTRYFMTANEAAILLLQAAVVGHPGDILVLDMGEPLKIVDLVEDLIRLSGYWSEEDISVEFVGPRPGEKLHERLHSDDEALAPTRHPRILRVVGKETVALDDASLDLLVDRAKRLEREELVETLGSLLGNPRLLEGRGGRA